MATLGGKSITKVFILNADIAFHYAAKRLYVYFLFYHTEYLKDLCPPGLRFNIFTASSRIFLNENIPLL